LGKINNKMKKLANQLTGVEYLSSHLKSRVEGGQLKMSATLLLQLIEIGKEIENQRLINLVEQLKDYTRESHNILGFDDREASEFVEIFKQQEQKSDLCNCSKGKGIDFDERGVSYCISCEKAIN